jgi:hypothetical protein
VEVVIGAGRMPQTREQRDWFHKLGNMPKRLETRVKAALHAQTAIFPASPSVSRGGTPPPA